MNEAKQEAAASARRAALGARGWGIDSSGLDGAPGFTLVEILVALAILGLILAAFAQVLSGRVLSAGRIDAETQALLFARSMMDRVGRDVPLAPGSREGALGNGGTWRLRIAPAEGIAPGHGIAAYLVELTVATPRAGPIVLTTLRVSPGAAP